MTILEYNDLVDCLYRGHDFIFLYNGQHYFLERDAECHNLYKVSEDLSQAEFLKKICGENLIIRINAFLEDKLFNNQSFNEIYSTIAIIDIE